VVIAGSERTTRRRSSRRQRDSSFFRFGPDLRQAREQLGLSLESVQDRTGVRRSDIEAIEAGDLTGFADEKAALVAVRRCAEILGLDAATMAQNVGEKWRNVPVAPAPAPVPPPPAPRATTGSTPRIRRDSAPVPVVTGHLSRYPGDASHLKAFTQTAQVPMVGQRTVAPPTLPPGLRFDSTDAIPVTWRAREPDPAPLALRVAVWSTVLLLVLGVAGVAVHHWRPAWLAKIHLISGGPVRTPASGGPSRTKAPAALVTETPTGPQSATLAVRAAVFSVVVTTRAPCWIQVTSPASFAPSFSATVPAGTTKTFTSSGGQLSVELGASGATVTAQIVGKTVPHWSLTPAAAPFVMNFHSAAT